MAKILVVVIVVRFVHQENVLNPSADHSQATDPARGFAPRTERSPVSPNEKRLSAGSGALSRLHRIESNRRTYFSFAVPAPLVLLPRRAAPAGFTPLVGWIAPGVAWANGRFGPVDVCVR